jgi:hypothetical protein
MMNDKAARQAALLLETVAWSLAVRPSRSPGEASAQAAPRTARPSLTQTIPFKVKNGNFG